MQSNSITSSFGPSVSASDNNSMSLNRLHTIQKIYTPLITYSALMVNKDGKKGVYPDTGYTSYTTIIKATNPKHNSICVKVGPRYGIVVIDLDKMNDRDNQDMIDGPKYWDTLCSNFGGDINTIMVDTPSGGRHIYFTPTKPLSETKKFVTKRLVTPVGEFKVKIDYLSDCHVTAAGSLNPIYNKRYEFVAGHEKKEYSLEGISKPPKWVEDFILCDHIQEHSDGGITFEKESLSSGKELVVFEEDIKCSGQGECNRFKYTHPNIKNCLENMFKAAGDNYVTWRDVCFCILGIIDKSDKCARYFMHLFSKLCPVKYDVKAMTDIDSWPRKTQSFGLPKLREIGKRVCGIEVDEYLNPQDDIDPAEERAKIDHLAAEHHFQIERNSYADEASQPYFESIRRKLTTTVYDDENEMERDFITEIKKVHCIINLGNMSVTRISPGQPFSFQGMPSFNMEYQIITKKGPIIIQKSSGGLLSKHINYIDHYDDIVYRPPISAESAAPTHGGRILNTWTGFQAKLVDKIDMNLIQPILNHFKEVWCAESEEQYKWLIGAYFKPIFLQPGIKMGTSINLVGTQGAGKNAPIDDFLIPFVFGRHQSKVEEGIDRLTQRFNHDVLFGKIFISVNELSTIDGNGRAKFDKLKAIITQTLIGSEIKGGAVKTIDCYVRLIMSSNNPLSLYIESNDRRYCVLQVGDKYVNDFDYFRVLYSSFTQIAADHFFTYCSRFETTHNPRRPIMSGLKMDMIISSLPPPVRFLYAVKEVVDIYTSDLDEKYAELESAREWFQAGECLVDGPGKGWISSTKLYDIYKAWSSVENETTVSSNKFTRMITGYTDKKHTKTGTQYNMLTIKQL